MGRWHTPGSASGWHLVEGNDQLALVAMGIHIFDNCALEELSKEAAKCHRCAVLLTAAPIAVSGGTGSPLNTIATF